MATATPKTFVGKMDCLCCGHEIPVKQAENGTLNASCPWCDLPAYAKKGTGAHRLITAKLRDKPEAAQAPAATTPPAAPAAKAPTPANKPAARMGGIFAGL